MGKESITAIGRTRKIPQRLDLILGGKELEHASRPTHADMPVLNMTSYDF
jgi:hypothetical protein